MKSERLDIKKTKKDVYPCLKEYVDSVTDNANFIVLFVKDCTGMVVWKQPECNWRIGHYNEEWAEWSFKDCNASVTLSNED